MPHLRKKYKKGIADEMTWVWLQKGHLKRVIASALVEFQTKYLKTDTINTQEIQGIIQKNDLREKTKNKTASHII